MKVNPYTTDNQRLLVAASSADGETPVNLYADPTSHELLVSAAVTLDASDIQIGAVEIKDRNGENRLDIIQSVDDSSIYGIPVLNPDGSSIAGASTDPDNPNYVQVVDGMGANMLVASLRDTNNETTTNPGASSNYTGTFTDIRYYGSALILVVSDVAMDSAVIEWSNDGVDPITPTLVSTTTLTEVETGGFFVYFNFMEQSRNGFYYRLNVDTDTNPAIFETISYLQKDRFNGSYSDAVSEPSLQNRYLLTRSQLLAEKRDGGLSNVGSNQQSHLYVSPEYDVPLGDFETTTGWTAFDTDTTNLATTTKHVSGVGALTFDKANTSANNTNAGIEMTLESKDLSQHAQTGVLACQFYLPDISDVIFVFVRLGTDSSNYNEWRMPVADITAATWISTNNMLINEPNYSATGGDGWDSSAVTYIAMGVGFNLQGNTLSGIVFDNLVAYTAQHTTVQTSSSVSTPNVNIQKVGGANTDHGAGSVSSGSQRITIATDDSIHTKLTTISSQQQQDALTDTELRASDVGVDTGLTQPTTPSDTQPVSATSLPLPSGAATAANQQTDALTDTELRDSPVDVEITNPGDIGSPSTYTTIIDVASATITYIGDADPGSATSSSVWRIKRVDTSSGTVISLADGVATFTNVWDDRAGYSYS